MVVPLSKRAVKKVASRDRIVSLGARSGQSADDAIAGSQEEPWSRVIAGFNVDSRAASFGFRQGFCHEAASTTEIQHILVRTVDHTVKIGRSRLHHFVRCCAPSASVRCTNLS